MKRLLQALRASLRIHGIDPDAVVKPKSDRRQRSELAHRAWERKRTAELREARERFQDGLCG